MTTICLDKTYIILLTFTIIIILIYKYDILNKKESTNINTQKNNMSIKQIENKEIYISPTNIFREYDYRVINDPLFPPYKRDDYNINPSLVYPTLYSIPTRGYMTYFKQVGILTNNDAENADEYKFLLLMGRQKYRGSNNYEYYAISSSKDNNIKFDLNQKKELYTDDTIIIQQLNNTTYNVTINKNLNYEYIY